MKISILDDITRQNIVLFKELMRKMSEKQLKELAQKTLSVYVNNETGEISLESKETPKWKTILLKWDETSLIPLEVEEGELAKGFYYGDLKPSALRRLADTIRTLNRLAFDPKHKISPHNAIAELEVEQLEKPKLIEQAWHDIDRKTAEKMLASKRIGTYLFRRGEFAPLLKQNLHYLTSEPLNLITLTFKESEGKIAERIIVEKTHEWLFYDDDPSLKTICYLTLDALLETMGEKLCYPLLH